MLPNFIEGVCSIVCALVGSCSAGFSLVWAKVNWQVAAKDRTKRLGKRGFIKFFVKESSMFGKKNMRALL